MSQWLSVVFEGLCEFAEVSAVPDVKDAVEEDMQEGEDADGGGGKGREKLKPFAEAGGLWQLDWHTEIRGVGAAWRCFKNVGRR